MDRSKQLGFFTRFDIEAMASPNLKPGGSKNQAPTCKGQNLNPIMYPDEYDNPEIFSGED